jgi:hypothetical protein
MLWAQFHFGLSVCPVKVVRHKKAEYSCVGLWKSGGLPVAESVGFQEAAPIGPKAGLNGARAKA